MPDNQIAFPTQYLIEPGNGSPWKGYQIVCRTGANNDVIIAWVPFARDVQRIAKLLREDEAKT